MSKIKQTKAPSFADLAVIDRRNKMRNPFLSQINQLVDWRPISNVRPSKLCNKAKRSLSRRSIDLLERKNEAKRFIKTALLIRPN